MKEEYKEQIWTTQLLILLGGWLWDKKEYGHALLCLHGSSLGMKVGAQLGIRWSDYIDDFEQMTYVLRYDDGKLSERQLGIFFQDITLEAFEQMEITDRNSLVYVNAKTEKPLTTSTLNRELLKFSKEFILDIYQQTGRYLRMQELKSNAFEIAWGVDMVKKYMLTKKVFTTVSKHMGHRTLHDTYELLGLTPNDEIRLRFDLANVDYTLESLKVLKNKEKLTQLIQSIGLQTMSERTLKEKKIQI